MNRQLVAALFASVIGLVLLPVLLIVLVFSPANCGAQGDAGTLSAAANAEIPANMAAIYRAIAAKEDIDVAFLASIGKQESDHGRNPDSKKVNWAGCVGVMQVGIGGACGDFWGRNKCDGDGDGKMEVLNPWDNVCASARGLRHEKNAPPAGGSEEGYYRAACGYYGACDTYAPEVMARAKRYGFVGGHVTAGSALPVSNVSFSESCVESAGTAGPANLTAVVRHTEPRKMVKLPAWATARGYRSPAVPDGQATADARIVPALLWLLRRYDLRVHDCLASGHNTHGTGDSCDIVPAADPLPRPGVNEDKWGGATQMARDLGWHEPGPGYPGGYACNSGMPFKGGVYILCYNGDINHGDPAHVFGGCACPHVHITFDNPTHGAPVALGTPPAWVTTFAVGGTPDSQTAPEGQRASAPTAPIAPSPADRRRTASRPRPSQQPTTGTT